MVQTHTQKLIVLLLWDIERKGGGLLGTFNLCIEKSTTPLTFFVFSFSFSFLSSPPSLPSFLFLPFFHFIFTMGIYLYHPVAETDLKESSNHNSTKEKKSMGLLYNIIKISGK